MYKDLHGFIRVQKLHQSDYTAFYSGLAFGNRKQYDKAITHYTKALELNPQLFEAYNNRGNAYRDKGEFDHAITDHYTAIRLKPDYTLATYNLCEALLAEYEWEQRNQT